MQLSFKYLDKSAADKVLPVLFDILFSNMNDITPSGMSRDEEFNVWFSEVSNAIQKAPRQIILMLNGGKIIGYFQYYIRDTLLMMEEIQIQKEYHGSGVFGEFYRWLVRTLPRDLQVVEAFADKRNTKSRAILAHLELKEVNADANGLLHFKGDYNILRERYTKYSV